MVQHGTVGKHLVRTLRDTELHKRGFCDSVVLQVFEHV